MKIKFNLIWTENQHIHTTEMLKSVVVDGNNINLFKGF